MVDKMTDKKKELINMYWYSLIILGIVGIINLFVISKENLETAAIVDFVLLVVSILLFVLGYVDYKNYKPFSKIGEVVYCATAVITIWIFLVHFNVQNYTFVSQYTEESTYMASVSAVAAAYIAVGIVCVSLTFINLHNRKKQATYYYAVAAFSIISSIVLLSCNYDTKISLFWAPLRLMKAYNPPIVDTAMTILALRVLVEYFMFIIHGYLDKKHRPSIAEGDERECHPTVAKLAIVALVFMLVNLIVLPILNSLGEINYQHFAAWHIAYEVVESVSVAVLLIIGGTIVYMQKKSAKYGQIYQRMGIAAIVFALVYLIMDFFPINDIIKSENAFRAQMVSDIFTSCVQIMGLIVYTAYVAFNKKLNATLLRIDVEREIRLSSENYHI